MKNRYIVFGLLPAGISTCILFLIISFLDLPNYAHYTGIRPIETKIKLMQKFEKENTKIDAIILGSSIVDFGFSAKLFSQLMSTYDNKIGRAHV